MHTRNIAARRCRILFRIYFYWAIEKQFACPGKTGWHGIAGDTNIVRRMFKKAILLTRPTSAYSS
jgi:hypothetical protein